MFILIAGLFLITNRGMEINWQLMSTALAGAGRMPMMSLLAWSLFKEMTLFIRDPAISVSEQVMIPTVGLAWSTHCISEAILTMHNLLLSFFYINQVNAFLIYPVMMTDMETTSPSTTTSTHQHGVLAT